MINLRRLSAIVGRAADLLSEVEMSVVHDEAVTLWSWRWRQAERRMKWINEGRYDPETAALMLAKARAREPKVAFVLAETYPPANPVWHEPERRWRLPDEDGR